MDSIPRGLDYEGGMLLVGLRNADIKEYDLNGNANAPKVLMKGHSDGELWGLEIDNNNGVILTTCDDNKVMAYSIDERKCIGQGTLNEKAG